jgi:lysozyme
MGHRVSGVVVVGMLATVACGGAPTAGEDVGSSGAAVTVKCGASADGPIQGVDVSDDQGNFDWESAHVKFGYAQVSDGLHFKDSTFDQNWSRMKTAGVLRGAYQYFEPEDDETEQANMVVAKVGHLGAGDLPAMIDVEKTGGLGGSEVGDRVLRWLQIVEAGTGVKPIIYTGSYFWEGSVGTDLKTYPIWIAAYGPSCPSLPQDGWTNWTMWQYSDGGGHLDHDVFNGTLDELKALVGPVAGKNGSDCSSYSPYDCKLSPDTQTGSAANRVVQKVDGKITNSWAVTTVSGADALILDGYGNELLRSDGQPVLQSPGNVTFNYGQVRKFGGADYVFALSTDNKSTGWLPAASIEEWSAFKSDVGSKNAVGSGLADLGCYEVMKEPSVSASEFANFSALKVVRYAPFAEGEEKVGNYTSWSRESGAYLANMLFNVTKGSPAIDIFPAGTKFQRLHVPTWSSAPSIDVDLYSYGECEHDGKTAKSYCVPAGQLKFIYGRVLTPQGENRYGWMALEGTSVLNVPPPAHESSAPHASGNAIAKIAAALVPASNCNATPKTTTPPGTTTTTSGGTNACTELEACCPQLPASDVTACDYTVSSGGASDCGALYTSYKASGLCK